MLLPAPCLHHNPIFGLEIDTLICEHVINPIPILRLWNMQMNLSFDSGPYSASCIEKLISPPITRPLLPGGDGDLNWIRVPGPSSVHGRLSKVKVWCCRMQEHENGSICDKKLKLSFVAGCRITTMNDLPIGNLYVMMLITIIKGSWLWNASDHDVENENDWHRLALIGIVRHAGGESLYIYYFTSREDNLSLWVIHTITFITFSGNTGISIIFMLYLDWMRVLWMLISALKVYSEKQW